MQATDNLLRLVMPYYCGNEQTSFSAEASELNRKLPTLHRAALPAVRLMPNSHRPPDTTRRSCLCRVRRCELSLETVWQRLNSQLIDHPRRVTFTEEVQALSYAAVITPTACLHFAWRTTSLRVGGLAARPNCMAGLRRGAAANRHTPTQTRHRTHLSSGRADSVHTATPDTTKQSCQCRVWHGGVNWIIAVNVFKLQILCRRKS